MTSIGKGPMVYRTLRTEDGEITLGGRMVLDEVRETILVTLK